MNLLSPNMDQIADVIIRPSRHLYKITDLGPKTFQIDDHNVTRSDFEIKNNRGQLLKCSYYSKDRQNRSDYVLIYLHCNSGCRIEGLTYLRLAIQNDFSYLIFDFGGSGVSEGKFVSLGFYQAQDLQTVINYIKRHINDDAKFCLWGRSMGAVTALRYLALNKELIHVSIFDSPFQSLKKLFIEIGKQRTNLPQILLNVAYKYIKPIIISKAEFDIDQVDLDPLVSLINSPGIFIASKQDALIPFQQIDQIFDKYKGQKEMFFIEESHNQARNMAVIKKVFKAIKKYLFILEQNQLKKQKTSFYSIIPQKDLSKKKLQLTIKSLSQRQLKNRQPSENYGKLQNMYIDFNLLQKRQASCLFSNNINKERKVKKSTEAIIINQSESFFDTKRRPLAPKHMKSQMNMNFAVQQKLRPKFAGEVKAIEVKLNIKDQTAGKSRQRKTLQHISNKRPPFVELRGGKQTRSSFDLRYRI